MSEPNWTDIMKYDGSRPEPPYDVCDNCAAYEARIAALEAELARVKAESVRVVCMPDNGNLYDWYMTPTGLGYPGKDRKQNNCIESAEGYYRLDDCQPVRLERWEDEE